MKRVGCQDNIADEVVSLIESELEACDELRNGNVQSRNSKRSSTHSQLLFLFLTAILFAIFSAVITARGSHSATFLSTRNTASVKVKQKLQNVLQTLVNKLDIAHDVNQTSTKSDRPDFFLTMRPTLCRQPSPCSTLPDGSMVYNVQQADSLPVIFRADCEDDLYNYTAVEIAVHGAINGSFSVGYSHWMHGTCGAGGWAWTHLSSLVQGDRYGVQVSHNITVYRIPMSHFLHRPAHEHMHAIRLLGFKTRPNQVRFLHVKFTDAAPPPGWQDPGPEPTSPSALYCRRPGVIALCIDDGNDVYMERTLDRLKEAEVPATFFLVGRHMRKSAARERFVRRAVAEGHSIQHHTWDHGDMSELPTAAVEEDLDRTLAVARDFFGLRMSYFRPPRGRYDAGLLRALAARNMSNVMWTYTVSDYGNASNQSIWARFQEALDEHDPRRVGMLGVQHFSVLESVDLIPQMARAARQRGWRFVSLDECLS